MLGRETGTGLLEEQPGAVLDSGKAGEYNFNVNSKQGTRITLNLENFISNPNTIKIICISKSIKYFKELKEKAKENDFIMMLMNRVLHAITASGML